VLLAVVENISVKTSASQDEKEWVGSMLVMLLVFFTILFLIKFIIIVIAFAFKLPIISYIFAGISGFVKHIIEGFLLNSQLAEDEVDYSSRIIHILRYFLLVFVVIYCCFLIFCLAYLLKVLFCDQPLSRVNNENDKFKRIINKARKLQRIPFGKLFF
jgi:uncharacterized membrane protein